MGQTTNPYVGVDHYWVAPNGDTYFSDDYGSYYIGNFGAPDPDNYHPKGPEPAQWDHSIPDGSTDPGLKFNGTGLTGPPPLQNLPPLPDLHGKGKTVVNTEALSLFERALNTLIVPVALARGKLDAVNVAPGAFYEADQIRDTVNGPKGTKVQQADALLQLESGLTALRNAVLTMVHKYSTAEELNKADADDVQELLTSAGSYFGRMGGGSGSGGGGSGSGPSS
jgi:hypothetical protein